MRNKKIQILLVFVLAIGLFGLLFYWRYGEKKQMESLNGLQETYKEYDKKIREIRNDMENKKAEVNDIEKPANVILAFSEEDQELMDRIVPALEGRGIQATLVLKNTAEHHQETVTYLGQQGWDFAFGGEIGEEKDAYTKQDAFNKEANARAEVFLAETFCPAVRSGLSQKIGCEANVYIDEKDKQTVIFAYPHLFTNTATLQVIRLEIGALAAWTPAKTAQIEPYAAEYYPKIYSLSL